MLNDKILDNIISGNDPLDNICNKEFVINVLKFGAYLSIVNNKRINASVLFMSILENSKLRDIFMEITGAETVRHALLQIMEIYPVLVKSKNTKRIFEKSKGKNDRDRKNNL